MVEIIRNAGGIPGFHVALEVFSESVERRLFENGGWFEEPNLEEISNSTNKCTNKSGPTVPVSDTWSDDIYKIANAVKDCGLVEDYIMPDYCLPLSFKAGTGSNKHFDSKYRWGETVVGISTGQACVMYFAPGNKKTVKEGVPHLSRHHPELFVQVKHTEKSFSIEMVIPRRSIYCMSGPSRVDWQHGIRTQTKARLQLFPNPPAWNPNNLRRSLTLRAHKMYSDLSLAAHLKRDPNNQSLKDRIQDQKKYRPRTKPFQNLSAAALKEEKHRATCMLEFVSMHPMVGARFQQADLTFPLPQNVFCRTGDRTERDEELHHQLLQDYFEKAIGSGGGIVAGSQITPISTNIGSGYQMMSTNGQQNNSKSNTDYDQQMQEAIRRSLEEASSAVGTTSNDPICLDDDDEDNKSKNNASKKAAASSRDSKLAAVVSVSPNRKRARDENPTCTEGLRAARLAFFDGKSIE